jgi:hypothetical protein
VSILYISSQRKLRADSLKLLGLRESGASPGRQEEDIGDFDGLDVALTKSNIYRMKLSSINGLGGPNSVI